MTYLETFQSLLDKGYFVKRRPFPVSSIVDEGLARERAGLPIPENRAFLLDPGNWDETVVILQNPQGGDEALVVTKDEKVLQLANEQYESRFEPVGTWIRVHCAVEGAPTVTAPMYRVDELVPSLNGIWRWEFEPDDVPSQFIASLRIDDVTEQAKYEALRELKGLLDGLAAVLGIGIRIWHQSIAPVLRELPSATFGKEVRMLRPLSEEEKQQIDNIASSEDSAKVADGLNRAYCESSCKARFNAFWTACEDVFRTDGERLLLNNEVTEIVEFLPKIESLASDDERLKKATESIPNRLQDFHSRSRNERIGGSIARVLDISEDEAVQKIKTAASLRGKLTHTLSAADRSHLKQSQAFLYGALQLHLDQLITPEP